MPELASLLTFAAIALGMVLTPGPDMVYLISRSICQGWTVGLISLGGVALGSVFYMLCAAFGITALVLAVPYAYDTIRIVGALYLLWLAWQAVRPGGQPAQAVPDGLPDQPAEPKDRGDVPVSCRSSSIPRMAASSIRRWFWEASRSSLAF